MTMITRYLLIYDHERDELVEPPIAFPGDEQAVAAFDAYDQAEIEYADRRDRYEVLLVGAESLDSVKATHGRFFASDEDLEADALAGA